ncbi:MAG: hypothetical protein K6G39_07875 [Bacteroidales bacterium]|nr:hypothetical protein [Bacteroidales bacterium]
MIWDPFYGSSESKLPGILNRVVLILEIVTIVVAFYLEIAFGITYLDPPYNYLAIGVVGFVGMSVLNWVLRLLCKLFNAIYYGSTTSRGIEGARRRREANKPTKWKVPKSKQEEAMKRYSVPEEKDGKQLSDAEKLRLQRELLKGRNR